MAFLPFIELGMLTGSPEGAEKGVFFCRQCFKQN